MSQTGVSVLPQGSITFQAWAAWGDPLWAEIEVSWGRRWRRRVALVPMPGH
jgi:hypothetical protein